MSARLAPARCQAGLDVLADLLDLGGHIALADAIAVGIAGELPGDKDLPAATTDRHHLGIGRLAGHDPDMDAGGLNLLTFDGHAAPFLGTLPEARPVTQRGLDVTDQSPPRDLSAAVPSERGKPDPVPRARPRADGVARQARLSRSLDRRAPFRRVRDHQF